MFIVKLRREGLPLEQAHVYSLAEASATVTAYQREFGLGASQLADEHGEVRSVEDGAPTHWVSYNGRVWELEPDTYGLWLGRLVYEPV